LTPARISIREYPNTWLRVGELTRAAHNDISS